MNHETSSVYSIELNSRPSSTLEVLTSFRNERIREMYNTSPRKSLAIPCREKLLLIEETALVNKTQALMLANSLLDEIVNNEPMLNVRIPLTPEEKYTFFTGLSDLNIFDEQSVYHVYRLMKNSLDQVIPDLPSLQSARLVRNFSRRVGDIIDRKQTFLMGFNDAAKKVDFDCLDGLTIDEGIWWHRYAVEVGEEAIASKIEENIAQLYHSGEVNTLTIDQIVQANSVLNNKADYDIPFLYSRELVEENINELLTVFRGSSLMRPFSLTLLQKFMNPYTGLVIPTFERWAIKEQHAKPDQNTSVPFELTKHTEEAIKKYNYLAKDKITRLLSQGNFHNALSLSETVTDLHVSIEILFQLQRHALHYRSDALLGLVQNQFTNRFKEIAGESVLAYLPDGCIRYIVSELADGVSVQELYFHFDVIEALKTNQRWFDVFVHAKKLGPEYFFHQHAEKLLRDQLQKAREQGNSYPSWDTLLHTLLLWQAESF